MTDDIPIPPPAPERANELFQEYWILAHKEPNMKLRPAIFSHDVSEAQVFVGGWLGRGAKGVQEDREHARLWYEKAADKWPWQSTIETILRDNVWPADMDIPRTPKGANIKFEELWILANALPSVSQPKRIVGQWLFGGDNVQRDVKRGMQWTREAALLGDASAFSNLSYNYRKGPFYLRSSRKSVHWTTKAAQVGETGSQTKLGDCYRKGKGGLIRDFQQAVYWYTKATHPGRTVFYRNGDAVAFYQLGMCYKEGGPYLDRNFKMALDWFEKAQNHTNHLYKKEHDVEAQISQTKALILKEEEERKTNEAQK